MKAEEIIDLVISRHEKADDSYIHICEGMHLEPMLNYSGKMARNAFRPSYKRNWHKDRKFVGVLDHKIMDPTGKMEQSELLSRSLEGFNREYKEGLRWRGSIRTDRR